jgi:cytochrome c oxidase subunit IV
MLITHVGLSGLLGTQLICIYVKLKDLSAVICNNHLISHKYSILYNILLTDCVVKNNELIIYIHKNKVILKKKK